MLATALAARGPRQTARSLPGALTLCLAIAWFASSLLLRFHGTHSRDDYRSASSIARAAAASGESVWWVASRHCGEYYSVPFCDSSPAREDRCVVRLESPGARDLDGVPAPDLIVLSRPEFYDHRGVVQSHIATHGFAVVKRPVGFRTLRASAKGATLDMD